MTKVFQARCPGCRKILLIPADQLHARLRCNHCGLQVQAKAQSASKELQKPKETVWSPKSPPPLRTETANLQEPAATNGGADRGQGGSSSLLAQAGSRSKGVLIISSGVGLLAAVVAVATIVHLARSGGGPAQKTPPPSFDPLAQNKLHPPQEGAQGEDLAPEKRRDRVSSPTPTTSPRRLLAISIHDYLYADPVTDGRRPRDSQATAVHAHVPDQSDEHVTQQLGNALSIPAEQRFFLSDRAIRLTAAPRKEIVEKTIVDFLDSCRPQDRIVLVFIGRAVEIDANVYLLPIDGEPDRQETLIALSWLYERLARCSATQKLLIIDVCRLDPNQGIGHPGGGGMSPQFEALLANPLPTVEVWASCRAGEHSYEAAGGVFIRTLGDALEQPNMLSEMAKDQADHRLPWSLLAQGNEHAWGVNQRVTTRVSELYREQQNPRVAGSAPAIAPASPAGAATAPRPVSWQAPRINRSSANKEMLLEMIKEINGLPPIVTRKRQAPLRVELLPTFSDDKLADYRLSPDDRPFRHAVTKAWAVLIQPRMNHVLDERLSGQGDLNRIKVQVLARQKGPAIMQAELEEAVAELRQAGQAKDSETSAYWRALYDLALARLWGRIAFAYEYNFMLGQIRKDELPPLAAGVHSGWRLWPRAELQSGAEGQKAANQCRRLLQQFVTEYGGTPWEIAAKRDLYTYLGLEWRLAH
jgi:hypothetical protein